MALLTAAQIAAALDAFAFTITLKEINGYVVQDVGRRIYPSIDVANVTGQENLRDVPTTNTKQIYKVILYYRVVGFGNLDEPDIKTLEDEIFGVIDGLQDTSTKITITESWKREPSVEGTAHVTSTLTVQTDEISSTSGQGIRGDQITIEFPAPLGTLNVIDLITDSLVVEKDLDVDADAEEIFSLMHLSGIVDVEVEITTTKEPQLDAILSAGTDISITLTKGGTAFVKTANLISRSNSAPREEIQVTVISMNIKE